MGYPLDTAAQNALLDAWLGDSAASTVPSSFEVALFTDHPLRGGVELDPDGGYARVVVANDSATFPNAVDGMVTSVPISFDDSTDAWSDTAPYAVLIDAADSTTRYLVGLLTEEVNVLGAATGPSVVLSFYFNTEA